MGRDRVIIDYIYYVKCDNVVSLNNVWWLLDIILEICISLKIFDCICIKRFVWNDFK